MYIVRTKCILVKAKRKGPYSKKSRYAILKQHIYEQDKIRQPTIYDDQNTAIYAPTILNSCRDSCPSTFVTSTFSSGGIISCFRSQPARRQSSETTTSQSPSKSISKPVCVTGWTERLISIDWYFHGKQQGISLPCERYRVAEHREVILQGPLPQGPLSAKCQWQWRGLRDLGHDGSDGDQIHPEGLLQRRWYQAGSWLAYKHQGLGGDFLMLPS